jgi:hypothetical protein
MRLKSQAQTARTRDRRQRFIPEFRKRTRPNDYATCQSMRDGMVSETGISGRRSVIARNSIEFAPNMA